MTSQRGFTIVELLIATAIMMAVIASTFALLNPAQGMFAAQPEAMEMQQRLRVGLDALTRDLMMAGAGTYSGPIAGSLGLYFAPVLPYRIGAVGADSAGQYFTDRITVVYVPPTSAQTRIADPIGSASSFSDVNVTSEPGCPASDPSCGFEIGMDAVVMDAKGAWDTFTVCDVRGATLQLEHRGAELSKTYEAGAFISQVATYTYWLKTDVATDSYQLMRYDGNHSDVPIADNIVGLAFEYLGEPAPGAADSNPVRLSQAELTDGPWYPDASSPGRYDADLLRVRTIHVTLRVQAAGAFRGPAGPLFFRGGTSTGSERYLPDHEITFDVSPRNLGPGH
jgi:type II secretory pathway pseudopilin PulG